MTRYWKIAVLASLLCSACRVGPQYQRPITPVPVALKELKGNDQWKMATPSDTLIKGNWWEIFGDPELNRLEELLNINNQNIKQAEAQFRQARSFVAANRANYYPTIGSSPSITQSDAGSNAGRAGGTSQSFSLPAAATWEPDLWGRVRLSVENAVDNAQVSAADLENLRLSAQALLASDYFALAAQDMQQSILRDTIEAYEKNLQLTINRYNGGVASGRGGCYARATNSTRGRQGGEHGKRESARAQFEHAIAMLDRAAASTASRYCRQQESPRSALRPFQWRFRRSFSSAARISPRESVWWPRPTRMSALPRPLTTRR